MKRKLALLLALVMILSMVPMNVFGVTNVTPRDRLIVTETYYNDTIFQIDFRDFITNTDNTILLALELSGGTWSNGDWNVPGVPNRFRWGWGADSSPFFAPAGTETQRNTLRDAASYFGVGLPAERTGSLGTVSHGTFDYTFTVLSNNRAHLLIDPANLSAMTGMPASEVVMGNIPLFYWVNGDVTSLQITNLSSGTGVVNPGRWPTFQLARRMNRGITVTPGDVVVFHTFAHLNSFTISENIAGSFGTAPGVAYPYWFRFQAPDDYRWGDFSVADLNNSLSTRYGNVLIIPQVNAIHRAENGRDLYVQLSILNLRDGTHTALGHGFTEAITLGNMWLIADDKAPLGNVNVNVWSNQYSAYNTTATANTNAAYSAALTNSRVPFEVAESTGSSYYYAEWQGIYYPSINNWDRRVSLAALQSVANGVTTPGALTYTSAPANPAFPAAGAQVVDSVWEAVAIVANQENYRWVSTPPSVSGAWNIFGALDHGDQSRGSHHVATRVRNQVVFKLVDEAAGPAQRRSGEFGQLTAWMVLEEEAPGAWSSTQGIDVVFRVPEGVKIQAANLHLQDLIGSNRAAYAAGRHQNFPVNLENHMPTNEGVLVKPDSVRVSTRLSTHSNTRRNLLYVQLSLSIEPGFEWKNGGDGLIEITAQGGSLSNLIQFGEPVGAAYANDPIALMDDDVIFITTTNTAYYTDRYDVGSVTIVENPAARLRRGDELWIYAIGGRQYDIELTANPEATISRFGDNNRLGDPTSQQGNVITQRGLELSRGVKMTHRFGSNYFVGMRYTVLRESPDGLAEITFEDVLITGNIYPNVEYNVVISGNAVARNDFYVYDVATENYNRTMEQLLFFDPPYERPLFDFEGTDATRPGGTEWGDEAPEYVADPPATVVTPPVIGSETTIVQTAPQSWTINEYTAGKEGYPSPFIMREVAGTNLAIGMVHARAIGEFLGLDVNWTEPTATLSGKDKYGNDLVIKFDNGASVGYINGVAYDIADYSGSSPSGTGTAYNENNGLYLPLRFIMNAYGGTIGWDAATRSATLWK
jgi:hypothetical protein